MEKTSTTCGNMHFCYLGSCISNHIFPSHAGSPITNYAYYVPIMDKYLLGYKHVTIYKSVKYIFFYCWQCPDFCVEAGYYFSKITDFCCCIHELLQFRYCIVQGKKLYSFSEQTLFSTSSFWFTICSSYKRFYWIKQDIPDEEGDKTFGIQSFSARLGQKRVCFSNITF